MMHSSSRLIVIAVVATIALSCSTRTPYGGEAVLRPSEVIDLGALVTEDLPQRLWGKAFLNQMGFTRPNAFDVIQWTFPFEGGTVSGCNAYYTRFNHGGPHVDAPNHYGLAGGLDSYPIEAFSGPLKVFDVNDYPLGRSMPADVFRGKVEAGDMARVHRWFGLPHNTAMAPSARPLRRRAAAHRERQPDRDVKQDSHSALWSCSRVC